MKFVFWFCFFLGTSSHASIRLDIDSEIGKGYFGTHWGLSQSFPQEENRFTFSQWNASVGGNQSKYEDSTTGEVFTTRGRQGSIGAGVNYDKKWNLDLSLFGTNTPETNYGESGSYLQGSYSLRNINENDFGFSVGLGVGNSKIGQKISFKIGSFTVNRDVELEKSEKSFFLSVSAFPWLTMKLDYQTYSYSRSKADLQAVYGSRFLNYYSSDLVNSIGGLPEYSGSVSLISALNDLWDLSFSARKTHLIVDDSDSKRYQVYVDRYFEAWTAGLGFSRSETTQSTEGSLLARGSFDF